MPALVRTPEPPAAAPLDREAGFPGLPPRPALFAPPPPGPADAGAKARAKRGKKKKKGPMTLGDHFMAAALAEEGTGREP
ncbi:MAG: hypothetical protein IT372_38465 [Polyangiaceae bacterium]|nr:hypothetical protein [Polyangiaceae bacterium]